MKKKILVLTSIIMLITLVGTVTVKVTSETGVGGIIGTVGYEGNITGVKIEPNNGYQLMGYEEGDTSFIAININSPETAEPVKITYTTKEEVGTGKITLKQIEISDKDDNTKEVAEIEKAINIVEKPSVSEKATLENIAITTKATKTKYTEGEKFDKTGMVVTAKYSDGTSKEITNYTISPDRELKTSDTKVIISYTEEGTTKAVEQEIEVKKAIANEDKDTNKDTNEDKEVPGTSSDKKTPDTTADKKMPYTGATGYVTIGLIAIIAVITIILYVKNKQLDKI